MQNISAQKMEYNSGREKLIIPEYGRNIQKMIEYAISLPDKEERTKAANTIVSIMALLNPSVKENDDYRHMLWDHLYIISDFKLEVDSPYPAPDPNTLTKKPEKLEYSSNRIKYRYYGKNVEKMIKAGIEMEEGPKKDVFLNQLANFMRMAYRMWNEDKVVDEVILGHIEELSGGKLKLDQIQTQTHIPSVNPNQHRKQQGRGNFNKRQGGKGKNYRKKN